jgi:hypothetical protein
MQNVQIYCPIISAVYYPRHFHKDRCDVILCGLFRNESAAVSALFEKLLEKQFLSRSKYIQMLREAEDDGHVDNDGLIPTMIEMTDTQFTAMLREKVGNSYENLLDVCDEYYWEEGDCDWNFGIERHMIL